MKITINSMVGDGQQGETMLAEGTTAGAAILSCLGVDCSRKALTIRVNGSTVDPSAVLSDGDRLTVAPAKVANAAA